MANDFSLLSVNIRNFNPVADAVAAGLQIADGSSLQLLFNPASDQALAQGLVGVYRTAADACHAPLGQRFEPRGFARALRLGRGPLCGVLHLPQLSLTGGARQGRVQVTAGFTDTARRASDSWGSGPAWLTKTAPTDAFVGSHIQPSHITRGSKTWQIFTRKILIDTAGDDRPLPW